MRAADWSMTETKLEFDYPFGGRPPKRDGSVNGGDFIRLGDTSLEIISTPGHTMGTLSLLFPVKLGAEAHLALLWGGTAFNFGRQVARMNAYIESVDRVRDIAKQRGVDVFLSNHNAWDDAVTKLSQMEAGKKKNPFVLGVDATERALTVMSECARANLASWNA
jgi:metallo-beta-lactamase class B